MDAEMTSLAAEGCIEVRPIDVPLGPVLLILPYRLIMGLGFTPKRSK